MTWVRTDVQRTLSAMDSEPAQHQDGAKVKVDVNLLFIDQIHQIQI